jgi:N-methylhydantoinase B/oxoprolinase/acetone carboxylase alpha subunit
MVCGSRRWSSASRVVPPGLAGGAPGAPSEVWLERDGSRRRLGGKTSLDLRAGDIVEIRTAGGGGWGAPDEAAGSLARLGP